MYEIYIAPAAQMFGVPKTREIYQQAIESGLPEKDAKAMRLKYAELEKNLGEIDWARGLYKYSYLFANPRLDVEFWSRWSEFEVQHGNGDTFREMLRKDIELLEEIKSEDEVEEKLEIAWKDVPLGVFEGLIRKRKGDYSSAAEEKDGQSSLGATEKIERRSKVPRSTGDG
ncbi:hypothetical protein CRG98_029621 [Punica granatum]|uniref:Pre-mRNA-splicing factor Syf1/CRNKL1-like C-terminal HAT-repeats domain-containing protein n=1 Tax=Punica granatum TaxID=22663 RepID=A0A2I0J268_PUNGR|nr:hypothetical protein CRG98_029621 [Punica granatum]